MTPLVVDGLGILRAGDGARLLDGVSLSVGPGEIVGLVGESGSGKSLTALAVIGLLPRGLSIAAGSVHVAGEVVAQLAPAALRAMRRHKVALIFQDPMTALNPTRRVGQQIADVLEGIGIPRKDRAARAARLLGLMELPDPDGLLRRWPHQLSGGQRQRVLIAMAFAAAPSLVIADEVTTALDVEVRGQILALLAGQARAAGSGLLLITHDLGAARTVCDRVVVMCRGRVVEEGPAGAVLEAPRMPYTKGLLAALPERGHPRRPLPVPDSDPGAGA